MFSQQLWKKEFSIFSSAPDCHSSIKTCMHWATVFVNIVSDQFGQRKRENMASGIEHCDVIHRAVSAPLLHLLVLLVFVLVQNTCFKPISLALIQFHDNLFFIFLAKYLLFAREWFIQRACLAPTNVQSVHHSFEYIRQWLCAVIEVDNETFSESRRARIEEIWGERSSKEIYIFRAWPLLGVCKKYGPSCVYYLYF